MQARRNFTVLYAMGWGFLAVLLVMQSLGFFQTQGIRWAFILYFSFLLSYLLTPVVRAAAWKFSILDQPTQRKAHTNATPLLGGVAIYLAFTISLLVNNIFDKTVMVMLMAGSLVLLVSVIDDMKSLSAKLKLLVQLSAATMVIASGVTINLFPRHGVNEIVNVLSFSGNIFLSYLWIIGITNAMNFLDGIDGLATGLGAVISLFLGIVAFQTGQVFLGWFAIAMVGSCLGFLPYNFRRSGSATIFLGDAGSIFIGFMLACLAITGEWSEMNPLVSICAPIMIFGILIFDMTHTTVARIFTGKVRSFHDWVAYVGRDHIHHRMFRLIQHKRKSVLLILGMSCCLGISAVIMPHLDAFDSSLIVFQGIFVFFMFSAVNFYHEKSVSSIQEKRSIFRVQILFDVLIDFVGKDTRMDGVVLDVSDAGAKLLLNPSILVEVGDLMEFSDKLDTETDLSWMNGKIQWKREVAVDGDTGGYIECGVSFAQRDHRNIIEISEFLHNKKIKEQIQADKAELSGA